ncbi:MAG: hypothetical protein IT158_30075 [Bryobacterales bacterium]|nr:hypothetical protein [Bryobacterales bacterium]
MSPEPAKKFYGKYRGTVINNVDPMQMARLQVSVPDVLGSMPVSSWAMPCVPVAGMQMGAFVLPPIGAGVWVEFEQGDPSYPIWVGGYWGSAAEVPALAVAAPPPVSHMVFQTQNQNTLMISDMPGPTGGILLKTTTGAMIAINDIGITISNGKGAMILMTGPTVTVNQGALVVT